MANGSLAWWVFTSGVMGPRKKCGLYSSKTSRRVGNWTHVLSVLGVHMLDIGCETHGFGKQFSSWYSPCHCVLAFFLPFAMFSAFMSFQNQRHFFAVFLKYAGFSTFLRAFFSIAKDSHLDWTVSFKTLAVFWNKLVPVFSHLHVCEEVQEDVQ